jgi:hypothetical protein
MLNRTVGTGFMCPTMGKLAAFWKEGIELTDCLSWGREGNVLNSGGNISFLKNLCCHVVSDICCCFHMGIISISCCISLYHCI